MSSRTQIWELSTCRIPSRCGSPTAFAASTVLVGAGTLRKEIPDIEYLRTKASTVNNSRSHWR